MFAIDLTSRKCVRMSTFLEQQIQKNWIRTFYEHILKEREGGGASAWSAGILTTGVSPGTLPWSLVCCTLRGLEAWTLKSWQRWSHLKIHGLFSHFSTFSPFRPFPPFPWAFLQKKAGKTGGGVSSWIFSEASFGPWKLTKPLLFTLLQICK